MNYRDTLFFIGKCLTISHDDINLMSITEQITSQKVDWDNVVKVSTEHYVFPALYCNLQRAKLLQYLPKDLVAYMQHITDLNRNKNLQILKQAKEINSLLLENNITPIFLKGTSFLYQGLYEDIGERMVGDIDFLVAEKDFDKTVVLMHNEGYQKTTDTKIMSPFICKHYPRLFNENKIAAVEIHLEMVKGKLTKVFNYDSIKESVSSKNGLCYLGDTDQLALTILAKQYNDDGHYYKTVSLRNSYDVFLLSLKIDSTTVLDTYPSFSKLLNLYLVISSIVFNTNTIRFRKTLVRNYDTKLFLIKVKSHSFRKFHDFFWKNTIYLQLKWKGLIRFIVNPEFRRYYLRKTLNS